MNRTGNANAFVLGERLLLPALMRPYRRTHGDPNVRRLRIFAIDPAASKMEGRITEAIVPYEPLEPGPTGSVFHVVDLDDSTKQTYTPIDVDAPHHLIQSGATPSPTDWQSHQQMVYAVAARLYETFQSALGRDPSWAFAKPTLQLRPHAVQEDNAWYDRSAGEVAFGYFRGKPQQLHGRGAKEWIFTCLSHDVVAHELAHAFLDGMRPGFADVTSNDVDGFHEGFSDIVAILHRFTHRDVVRQAIASVSGDLSRRSVLSSVASQFGAAVGAGDALRHAIESAQGGSAAPKQYNDRMEAHDIGEILLGAMFEAFARIYALKTSALVRLATGGSGILPPGAMSHDLVELLTGEAERLARQFLHIAIRAIDYCPPVDLQIGEYLRAAITADYDLVPNDPWGYRETLIAAFRRRGIYPEHVPTLSEDALLWKECRSNCPTIPELQFGNLRFRGDPGHPADEQTIKNQAAALGAFVNRSVAQR